MLSMLVGKYSFDGVEIISIGGVFPTRHGLGLHVRELVGLWLGSLESMHYCSVPTFSLVNLIILCS